MSPYSIITVLLTIHGFSHFEHDAMMVFRSLRIQTHPVNRKTIAKARCGSQYGTQLKITEYLPWVVTAAAPLTEREERNNEFLTQWVS